MLIVLVPEAPPVTPPVVAGTVHVYAVPEGTIPFVPFVGVIANAKPLRTVPVMAAITAVGLIVTVNVNEDAAPQLTVVGVTI